MAKKKPQKKKTKKVAKRVPITRVEWLENVLAITERNITPGGHAVDDCFAQQAVRIRKELEELRKAK